MKAGSPLGRPDAHLKVLTRASLPLLFVLCMLLAKTTAANEGGSPGTDRLRLAVEEAVAGSSGDMGVAIKHLESGEWLVVNGNRSYPMASTYKVAILVELFNQVDEGRRVSQCHSHGAHSPPCD